MKRGIVDALHGNGNIIAAAIKKGFSLSSAERRMIDRVRIKAAETMRRETINYYEMEGERGVRGSMSIPVAAEFRGLQDVDLFGLSTRLYNIEGDHVLNHSTVGVATLIKNKIMPLDLSIFGIAREILKEHFVLVAWWVISAYQVAKIKVGVRS